MMATRGFKVRLRGAAGDGEHVRLREFIGQLEALQSALNRTDELVSDRDSPSLYYRVTDLTHSSPATVSIEAVAHDPNYDIASVVVDKFLNGLETITREGRAPSDFDRQLLEAYKGLASPLRRHVSEISIIYDGREIPITSRISHTIDSIIGPDLLTEGTMKGELEAVNLHNRQAFAIYPAVGPKRIHCTFGQDLLEVVKSALGRHVTVTGVMKSKAREFFPYGMDVRHIEINPSDDVLPTLWDLRGVAPRATGGKDSVSFVRELRDAER